MCCNVTFHCTNQTVQPRTGKVKQISCPGAFPLIFFTPSPGAPLICIIFLSKEAVDPEELLSAFHFWPAATLTFIDKNKVRKQESSMNTLDTAGKYTSTAYHNALLIRLSSSRNVQLKHTLAHTWATGVKTLKWKKTPPRH